MAGRAATCLVQNHRLSCSRPPSPLSLSRARCDAERRRPRSRAIKVAQRPSGGGRRGGTQGWGKDRDLLRRRWLWKGWSGVVYRGWYYKCFAYCWSLAFAEGFKVNLSLNWRQLLSLRCYFFSSLCFSSSTHSNAWFTVTRDIKILLEVFLAVTAEGILIFFHQDLR